MSDVPFPNFSLQSSTHSFSAVWKLTRAMKKAGWTYKSSADGSAKDTTGTATNDKWGGNADPAADTYPTGLDAVAAWWNSQGPTMIKMPITSAPSGTFVRGEKVTQAVTAAEGEFIGYDFDSVGLTGHAVILPRTGTFNNTNVVTGAISSATLTPSGTIENFVSEIVFWKAASSQTTGSIYMQRVSNETENSSRFSVLASGAAGCTATVAPGGGGTGNALPLLGTYVALGANTGSITHSNWLQITSGMGKAQIVATNNTGASGISPDGTFWIVLGDTATSTQAQFFGYFRCENSEDADLDPFAFFKVSGVGFGSANIRVDSSGNTSLTSQLMYTTVGASNVTWKGWRRRGFSTNDSFVPLCTASLTYGQGGTLLMIDNLATPETVASAYTTKRVREPILLVSSDNTKKTRKGTVRWMWAIQGGTTFDTWDGRLKLCVTPFVSLTVPSSIIGPYDGTSTPLQV